MENITRDKTYEHTLQQWSEEARNVASQIIDKYGDPDEFTSSMLTWYSNGPWVKTVVTNSSDKHIFPMPHTDLVEQWIHYDVPPEKLDELARFDGSVSVKRTEGLMSARCHDEPANFLALNLAHDVITGRLKVDEAKEKYLQTLKDFRMDKPTPYMEGLQFNVPRQSGDPGKQMISKDKLESYKHKG
jgi:hypothetical protein